MSRQVATWSVGVTLQARGVAVNGVVGLDLPGEDDVLLLGGDLKGKVVELPAKHAGQDLNEAGVGLHEVVVDQASTMHPHLQPYMLVHEPHQFRLISVRSIVCDMQLEPSVELEAGISPVRAQSTAY